MGNSLLHQLIEAFTFLPGVGSKTAQRFAYYMLERDREGASRLAAVIREAMENITRCANCRMFSEEDLCWICCDDSRDESLICVVENSSGLMAMAANTDYQGVYFVLHGRLSPLDGIGPDEIGLDQLKEKLTGNKVRELILATSSTVEGDVTAHVISEMAAGLNVKTTRLAQGVPAGGDLEFVDATTLFNAFKLRRDY